MRQTNAFHKAISFITASVHQTREMKTPAKIYLLVI